MDSLGTNYKQVRFGQRKSMGCAFDIYILSLVLCLLSLLPICHELS